MGNAFQFVAPDPQKAMNMLINKGRRKFRITPSKMNTLVEQDNARRDAERTANGEKKRGPKPRS
jgi:hypothetical protein